MKKALYLFSLFFCLTLSAQAVRLANTDRQKIDSLVYRNDSLVIKIQNDVKRSLYLPGGAAGLQAEYLTGDGDITVPKYYYSDRNVTVTLRNELPVSSGTAFRSTHIDSVITVVPQPGMTFIGDGQDVAQGFIADSLSLATSYKVADNVVIVDGIYKPYHPPSNLYTLANAANPDNEVNAVTGFSGPANWTPTSVASNPTASNGTYSIKYTHGGPENTSYGGTLQLSGLTVGETYTISFDANRVSGGNFGIMLKTHRGWESAASVPISNPDEPLGESLSYQLVGKPTVPNPIIEINAFSNADPGNTLAIDNIVITKNP